MMPTTPNSRKIRKKKCERCGSTSRLGVHHKNGDHYDTRKGNIETLCAKCHSIKYPKREGGRPRGT